MKNRLFSLCLAPVLLLCLFLTGYTAICQKMQQALNK